MSAVERGGRAMEAVTDRSVADAMRRGTLTCQAETPIRTVARMMAEHRVHSVVVTDLDGVEERAWAIVTDADVVRAFGEDVDRLTAGEIAASELLSVRPDEGLRRAAQLMMEHEVSHLVVVEAATNQPVGVISSLDLAAEIALR